MMYYLWISDQMVTSGQTVWTVNCETEELVTALHLLTGCCHKEIRELLIY